MNRVPTWFKMFLSFTPLINAIPSQNVGEGVKAAMRYFKTGEEPPADFHEMSTVIYSTLKDSIDQAFIDCEDKSEKARKAVMTRWNKNEGHESNNIRPNTADYERIRPYTEKIIEKKDEMRQEERESSSSSSIIPEKSPHSMDDDDDPSDSLEVFIRGTIFKDSSKRIAAYRNRISEGLIRHAIERAIDHGGKTASYVTTILDGYIANGYKDVSEAEKAEHEFDTKKICDPKRYSDNIEDIY